MTDEEYIKELESLFTFDPHNGHVLFPYTEDTNVVNCLGDKAARRLQGVLDLAAKEAKFQKARKEYEQAQAQVEEAQKALEKS